VGVRVYLDDVLQRDGIDLATALFSESTGRVLVAVPREEDVKFTRLCEGRGYPVLRIGVTDAGGPDGAAVEVQDSFTIPLDELRGVFQAPMSETFGPVVGQR
jgi:phosphoribosylformylglycinamidine synthase